MRHHPRALLANLVALASLATLAGAGACGSSDEAAGAQTTPPSVGLGQAGAQDFGLFRQILERGEIPHPDTLDDIGFFAEHKLDYPPPDCGEDVCLHPLFGVMGNMITGSSCTVLQLGLNTPLDPADLPRPPLDVVLAIDVSGSMAGAPIDAVKAGLVRMLDHLEPDDRVTIVTYSDVARVVAADLPLDQRTALEVAIGGIVAGGPTNLYDGLFTAYLEAEARRVEGRETRVVLLSDGVANRGITDRGRMWGLAAAYAREGIGLTAIGIGEGFDVALMRGLAEAGAGNFYFVEDPEAAREVFTEEVAVTLFPVALDVEIHVATGPAWVAVQVYGTRRWEGGASGGVIRIPSLFIAGRRSASDPVGPGAGRRGGGGAILVELVARSPAQLAGLHLRPDELSEIGRVAIDWTDPISGERKRASSTVISPFGADAIPEAGFFTDHTVEKGFVMLNLYAGFKLAAELALDNDPGAAQGVLGALRGEVADWLETSYDPDIEDDLVYVDLFLDNLASLPQQTRISQPPEPWPFD